MSLLFKKILIANRGEIALRIIRSCKDMGIKTVAVYSTCDRDSLHVRFADEAICIGPPPGKHSYLNIPKLISAAEITNTDAIHPGYGFLSENEEFSSVCHDYGIKFIGPSPSMIRMMGDKSTAKSTMKKAGVPVIPGSEKIVDSVDEGIKIAKKITFPVMLKATAGGGGKGMRIVKTDTEFQKAWDEAKREAEISFGNGDLYIEKYIENPKHVEIQIVGDQYGKVCHLSERDCSVQRRNQKLLEETPSPSLSQKLREKMGAAAIKGAKSIEYEGLGTIEFLLDKGDAFYFMEMNTRVQVEHTITEEVINYDLIKEQIKVAAGIPVSGKNHYPLGHAIECRINAEDPTKNFMPSPGKITNLHFPGGFGVRIDSHVYDGYTIPPHYDSMIAKLIVKGQSREEAIARMKRALNEFVIEGVKTTIPFHLKLMDHPAFLSGDVNTKFIETSFNFSSLQ